MKFVGYIRFRQTKVNITKNISAFMPISDIVQDHTSGSIPGLFYP